ncbi:MAG: 7-cyano-7-deazaguanine synthase [Candidatus Omnitrophica bacterium]|nr:7-cyano-7-deazaguanine synthase [Candidatus Omnitrophota bacterium]MBI2173866.1 7-cyano-7-deazaguanine synthase [Candidatus Omnitrophota bacterium]MBI3010410.1 7-cyano-7-deazaguanine synthase [Candidatus Omnitrophota bacterium]
MSVRKVQVCALVSGGLDSALLLQKLAQRHRPVVPLYVRCGLIWEEAEMWWLARLLKTLNLRELQPLRVLAIPMHSLYKNHWSLTGKAMPAACSPDAAVYLPGRNVLLLSAAAIWAAPRGGSTIAIGTLKGNPFGDATLDFFQRLSGCLSLAVSQPVRILAPLRRFKKSYWIRRFNHLPFHFSFSCIHPVGHQHCGCCNKCAERAGSFLEAGIPDPTRYALRKPVIAS